MPQLIIQERGRDEPTVHNCIETAIPIGRQDDNIVQLRGNGVSRRHAKILSEENNFFLIDLKSGNGTFLNGMRIAPHEKHLLRPGDLINIDNFDIRFHTDESVRPISMDEEITDSDVLEVKLLKKVLTALDKETSPSVEVLNGAAEGKKLILTDEMTEFTIGRDPECEFPINEFVISRRHAKIIKRWGGIAIRDLESKNGTFVNNRRVVEEYLHDGDRLALGTIVFLFRNPQEINLAQLEEIQPKTRPAQVAPRDIPGLEAGSDAEQAQPAGEQLPAEQGFEHEEDQTGNAAEGGPLEEWGELEENMERQSAYPVPHARQEAIKRLTPIEIGMIGLGVLMLVFALITIVNLLWA